MIIPLENTRKLFVMIAKKQLNFTFDKEKHEAYLDGVCIPTVTQVLKQSGISNFDNVPKELLERNARFGEAVHTAIQYKCKGTLDEESVDEAIKPYIQAWDNFVEDFGYISKSQEVRGAQTIYRYSYGIDQFGEFTKGKYLGDAIGDIKTGAPKPADAIQLNGGYKLSVGKEYKNTFLIYLNPDFKPRGYKITFAINNKKDQGIFLAALSILNWKKEKGLL